ncbi:conjugal transfer protein TraX [Pseudomonas palleroniana]|uniref:Conjugal transfer protein TraX n=1 Tax=Pseudomonas palleroniana TaxID=191390 RepID=A0A1H5LKW4_9PSED|nr:TraX family protein [Pseudomonas palleroniana]KAB0566660.1 conjugal transfer protein TraX [Pseudomonas palleroniana]PTC25647.1 conjugal transfer protein TraX [Pseudomonas palleroniana]SEE76828.1 TraX protein [Pseudomonas palleroniana]
MHGTETMAVGRVRDGALDLLKWLALLSMVLDHLRYVGLSLDGLYVPGRLAFPWFCLAIAANLHRGRDLPARGRWRYLGWLLLFSVISEVPYRLFIEDADTLNVLPTLALGLLVARGWQQKALIDRGMALIAVTIAALFSNHLMFGFFGVLLPLVMLLVFRRRWYFSVLPGLVCVAANQWQILLDNGTPVALMGLVACLIAPLAGLVLLRHAKNASPPAMRRWAYSLYPVHFLLLLLVRQAIA